MKLLFLPIFLMSAVVHEYAHGWTALKFGDRTAKDLGRLSFNPLRHIDPLTTVLLPMFCLMAGWPAFAIAKPVPINPYNLRNPKKDMIWIAAAGPVSNLMIAFIASVVIQFGLTTMAPGTIYVLGLIVLVNIILAVFNLIPIPPLDGSRIVMGVLPRKQAMFYSRFERYGIFIIILLAWTTNVIGMIVLPTLAFVWRSFGLNDQLLIYILTHG